MVAEQVEVPCLFCGVPGEVGDLVIAGVVICAACEEQLINLSVDDPRYDVTVARLRVMWRCWGEAAIAEE